MYRKFQVVIPAFNCIDFLRKNLSMLENQTNKNYNVCIIDDHSTMKFQREMILEYCERNCWTYIFHEKNLGALAGIVEGINKLECEDEDVIVMIDGDDWLYDEEALHKLDNVYSQEDVYLTWGSFESNPKGYVEASYAHPIDEEIIRKKMYRKITDIFQHLKTFKYRLFREIQDKDLRNPKTGEYFRVSWDKAIMYPMLEMAGDKIRYIPEVLYVYNVDNPLNDFKIFRKEQIEATEYIRAMPKYPTLDLTLTLS